MIGLLEALWGGGTNLRKVQGTPNRKGIVSWSREAKRK